MKQVVRDGGRQGRTRFVATSVCGGWTVEKVDVGADWDGSHRRARYSEFRTADGEQSVSAPPA